MYMLIVHLLALMGLIQLARNIAGLCGRSRAVERRDSSTQTRGLEQVAASPAPAVPCGQGGLTQRRPASSSSSSVGRADLETIPAAPSTEVLRPIGRREELNNRRVEARKQAEELARKQREAVYVTSKGGRYRKNTCGDLRQVMRYNPRGIVQLTRQEAQLTEAIVPVATAVVDFRPRQAHPKRLQLSKRVGHGGVLGCIAYPASMCNSICRSPFGTLKLKRNRLDLGFVRVV